MDLVGLFPEVEEDDLDLAPIARIDSRRRIGNVIACFSASPLRGLELGFKSGRNFDG